jgi:hypothetical protein
MSMSEPARTYTGHLIFAALASALLLVAVLGWNTVSDWLSDQVFMPGEGEVSDEAETWVRVGLALVAFGVLLIVRGIWFDVAIVLLTALAISALLGNRSAVERTFAGPPEAAIPIQPRESTDARIALPFEKLQPPTETIARDSNAVVVTVIEFHNADGQLANTEARRHAVIAREEVPAETQPAEDVIVDIRPGTGDAEAGALLADLNAASAVYLLPSTR